MATPSLASSGHQGPIMAQLPRPPSAYHTDSRTHLLALGDPLPPPPPSSSSSVTSTSTAVPAAIPEADHDDFPDPARTWNPDARVYYSRRLKKQPPPGHSGSSASSSSTTTTTTTTTSSSSATSATNGTHRPGGTTIGTSSTSGTSGSCPGSCASSTDSSALPDGFPAQCAPSSPLVWSGQDLSPSDYLRHLGPADIAEVDAALAHFRCNCSLPSFSCSLLAHLSTCPPPPPCPLLTCFPPAIPCDGT